MKNTLLKKIGGAALTAVMVTGLGFSAFAAEIGTDGIAGSAENAAGNSVTVKKAITVINHDGYTYEPEITYTYTLANGVQQGTVTDADSTEVHYKQGMVSYLAEDSAAVQTAEFKADNEVAGSEAANASKDLTWTFNPEAFPSAGVYRYSISETATSVDPSSIGIERPADYDTDKFLDVYVRNQGEGLEIYGYVLVDDDADEVTSSSTKSQGWNTEDDLEVYETYNITVTKHITGGGADMTARFPFDVDLSGEMSSANITVTGDGENISGFSLEEGNDGEADSASVTGELGNGKTLTVKGLPKTVSYTVAEKNDTFDTYAIDEVTVAGGSAETITGTLEGRSEYVTVVTDGQLSGGQAITVDVTNKLDVISPTGVVLRFGPYAAIVLAGIALAITLSVRKNRKDTLD